MKKFVLLVAGVVIIWALMFYSQLADSQNPNRPEHIDDGLVCMNAVALSFYYHNVTDLSELQAGIWSIIRDPRIDDSQTYVYLTVFHTVQQVAHNIRNRPEPFGETELEEFWINVLNQMNAECEQLLMEQRFPTIN